MLGSIFVYVLPQSGLVVVETGFWGDPEILVTVSNLQYSIQGGKTI